ncbi:MAG: hypothetical protein RIC85_03015 [Gammaproteobacteria bacterium]
MGKTDIVPFQQQQVTLIHAALHEFILSRPVAAYGLYPVLNLIMLLIQKPILLVVFDQPIDEADGIRRNTKEGFGWLHTFRYPKAIREKFNREIEKRLPFSAEDSNWLIKLPGQEDSLGGRDPQKMYGLGVFYIQLEQINAHRRESSLSMVEPRLRADSIFLEPLNDEDFGRLTALFSSLRNISPQKKNPNHTHLRHLSKYWSFARDGVDLFPPREKKNTVPKVTVTVEEALQILSPVLQEIDLIYRELRGGKAGNFDITPDTESAAPLLWARHQEALAAGQGIRPPTLAFFLHLRTPAKSAGSERSGYRIVPIATDSICQDLAEVICDFWRRAARKNQSDRKKARADIEAYLTKLEVPNSTTVSLTDNRKLAQSIAEAVKIETFLDDRLYDSMTYPAFSSGISMFAPAAPASRCDFVAYGPNFLSEGEHDTAYIKPTLVAGFPFISVVTKTRGDPSNSGSVDFDHFYYNYVFHCGVIRRRVSKRVRQALHRTYLQNITRALRDEAIASKRRFEPVYEAGAPADAAPLGMRVVFKRGFLERVKAKFDKIAQILPYALIEIGPILAPPDNSKYEAGRGAVSMFGGTFWFRLMRNRYYDRKMIINESYFLKEHQVQEALVRGEKAAEEHWREADGPQGVSH